MALTLAAVVVRPWRLHEWVYVAGGLALLLATGGIAAAAAGPSLRDAGHVVVFLMAVVALAAAAERAGVFDLLALAAGHAARGSAQRLLIGVLGVGFLVTTLLSLDTTVVLLTPVVLAVARRSGAPVMPLALAVVYVANTGSLLLPGSNLTNLLVAERMDSGAGFVATFWLPQLAALVGLWAVLALWHRRVLDAPLATNLPPQQRNRRPGRLRRVNRGGHRPLTGPGPRPRVGAGRRGRRRRGARMGRRGDR